MSTFPDCCWVQEEKRSYKECVFGKNLSAFSSECEEFRDKYLQCKHDQVVKPGSLNPTNPYICLLKSLHLMLDFQMILKLICLVCQRVWHLMLFHLILKLMSGLVKEFLHLSCSSSRTQTHVLFVKEVCIFCSQLRNCL